MRSQKMIKLFIVVPILTCMTSHSTSRLVETGV